MLLPLDFAPMEARLVDAIPEGPDWQYEPKWDGFRAIAFRDGDHIELQSKSQKPLGRYFPEIIEALRALEATQFVLDGELVIRIDEQLSFDDLLARIHPAASRVAMPRGRIPPPISFSICSRMPAGRFSSIGRWPAGGASSSHSPSAT